MLQQFIVSGVNYEIFIRLIVAALLGILIGTERKLAHPRQAAGMRTFSLIALSAALFAVIAEQLSQTAQMPAATIATLISPTISGIGFIGAGLIFLKHEYVNGLTTAAGLWMTAGIGMACGLGYYVIAAFSTVLAVIVLGLVSFFEDKLVKDIKKR